MKIISSKNTVDSFFETEVETPKPTGHDLLVDIEGISVNPVDIAVRSGISADEDNKVIGYDAVGIVSQVGNEVSLFKPGDKVYYAGSIIRPGSNSEKQLVDERIVGNAPKNLSNAEIAAMPLTGLTAWEALFEKLQINPQDTKANKDKTMLIINGSGGVGSIATQLAHMAGITVISTASRDKTVNWTKEHGADYVVNHRKNLVDEMKNIGFENVDFILGLNDIDGHWDEMSEIIKPDGHIASITENRGLIDLQKLTSKRATFSWEFMFSKALYKTPNMISQHDILNNLADLLDQGIVKSTLTKQLNPINPSNLSKAHEMVADGHMIGKLAIVNN